MTSKFLGIICLWIVATCTSARSQELLVPIDGEGKILRIDHELATRLQLFQETKGLRDAYLLQLPDSSYVLEIWFDQGERTLKIRRLLTISEAMALRQSITRAIAQKDPAAGINQEGRSKMLGTINALTLGYYGWAIPAILEIEGAAAVGTYTLLGAASFFLPYSATERSEISDEAATLFMYGSSSGIFHGIAVWYVIFGHETTFRGALTAGIVGSLAEGSAAFSLAKKYKLTSGSVEVIGSFADLGLGYGFGAAYVGDFTDNRRLVAVSMLIGSAAGIITAATLTARESYTSGDANVLRSTAMLSAYLPVAAMGIAETGDSRTLTLAAMIGGAVGVGLGHSLVSGKDFSSSQGVYTSLGTLGGGLIGLGISAIINADSKVYLALSSAGAVIGFSMMYANYAPLAKASAETARLEFSVHPESIALQRMGNRNSSASPLPLVSLRYTF